MKKNLLEWIVFAVSLVLVLSVAGYLIYTAVTLDETPPYLVVELGEPSAAGEGAEYRVPFTLRNRGSQSAADVLLEVTLEVNGEPAETSEVTIPLLPYKSMRKGTLIFHQDPSGGTLVPEIKNYLEP